MPDLSVIIPAYNAEAYIASSVSSVAAHLQSSGLNFEIIVVSDGSVDHTATIVEQLSQQVAGVRLVALPENQGKFAALTVGMAAAQGSTKLFTDADIPFDLEAITYIHGLIAGRGFHLVIGDRALAGSHYALEMNFARRLTTFLFSALVRMLVTGGLFDTQCGLKGFRADVADAIFPLLSARGFSGDVELLYIALKYNLEIKRIPVRLRNAAPSSVRIGVHGFNMLANISLLKIHWMLGRYTSPALRAIANQEYWRHEPSPN